MPDSVRSTGDAILDSLTLGIALIVGFGFMFALFLLFAGQFMGGSVILFGSALACFILLGLVKFRERSMTHSVVEGNTSEGID